MERGRDATVGRDEASVVDEEPISGLERWMFSSIPRWILVLSVLGMFLLACILLMAAQSKLAGSGRFGPVGDLAVNIGRAPSDLSRYFTHDDFDDFRVGEPAPALPDGFSRIDPKFNETGYILLSRPDEKLRRTIVRLIRLSDHKVLREWRPDIDAINASSRYKSVFFDVNRDRGPRHYRITHPMLMPDGGLIFHGDGPLVRIDACSRIEWIVNGYYGHSIEPDSDGNIWSVFTAAKPQIRDVSPLFREEALAKISPTGKVLDLISVAHILRVNQLGYLWRGRPYTDDAFHMNDVQPVLADGPYWKKGDLFISLRSLSMVALYRPSTGKILWWLDHPWRMQHDVEMVDNHSISTFSNNVASGYAAPFHQLGRVRGHSRGIVYDFATGKISQPFDIAMNRENIRSWREGRLTPLPNGDAMIEETVFGRVMRVSRSGEVRWQYIAADSKQRRFMLNWTRYLDPAKWMPSINAAASARCS